MSADGPPLVLRIEGLVKTFDGVPALRGVDLEVVAGEVHGLLGANGCGKSTLIKSLAGFHVPDSGRFTVAGSEVSTPFGPGGPRDKGVAFVHQDLGLATDATVLEHLALDATAGSGGLTPLSWRNRRRAARELLARFEVVVDVDATIGSLSPVQRALVAIVRAASAVPEGAGLLVLDEPTVFLPRDEVAMLFALLRRLAASGSSVLLVSHDLDEILAVTDRVTVLRDGEGVGTVATADTTRADVVAMILGRADEQVVRNASSVDPTAIARLEVQGLTGAVVRNLSLSLRAGEVLGVTGLAGSGFEELPDLVYGAVPMREGRVLVDGEPVASPTPARMLRRRVILIPADRKTEASAPQLSLLENLSVPFLAANVRGGRLRWPRLRARAQAICTDFAVVPPDPQIAFGSLSGGNQQKALIGKWMYTGPGVMLLNEPTQGVDIGARREIFRLVREAVSGGMTVLCATSDYEQLVELADRVIVLAGGRATGEINATAITKDSLAAAVFAGEAAA